MKTAIYTHDAKRKPPKFKHHRQRDVYVRGDAQPVPTPPGSQRQTVYGSVTLNGQTCFMIAKKTNGRSFIRYLDKLWRRFGKSAVIVDNAAYHDSRLV